MAVFGCAKTLISTDIATDYHTRYSGGDPLKTPAIQQNYSWSRSLIHIAFPEYLVPFLYYNEKFHYQVIGIFEIPIT